MPSDLTNNTPQTARTLSITGQTPIPPIFGSLSSAVGGDPIDYYQFTTSAVSNLKLSISGLTGNARLKVFSQGANGALGNEIISNSIPGNTTSSSSSNTGKLSEAFVFNGLQAGKYTIQVDLDATTQTTQADYGLEAQASVDGASNTLLWRAPGTDPLYFWKMNGSEYTERIAPVSGFEVVGIGDFNGDKTSDILWRQTVPNGAASAIVMWLMNPDNTLQASAAIAGGVQFDAEIVVAGVQDLNGDGKADIIFRNTNPSKGYAYFWTMDGLTNVGQQSYIVDFLRGYDIVGFGDFNGDGKKDVVWRNAAAGGSNVAIWLMNGGQVIGSAIVNQPMPSNLQLLGVKNLNATVGGSALSPQADKNDDLVWYDNNTGEVTTWTMNGTSIKQATKTIAIPKTFFVIGVEDVSGDGNADIVWRNEVLGRVGVWLFEGNNIKASEFAERTIPSQYYAAGFADFNGDGATDILWRNRNNQATGDIIYDAASVWLMGGISTATGQPTTSKAESFLLNPGSSSFPLDVNQLRRLPSNFKVPGFLSTQFSKVDQSAAGASVARAFNIGTLDGEGNYQDSVLGAAADYFKFKADKTTITTIDLTTAFGVATPVTNAEFTILRDTGVAQADGSPTLQAVTLTGNTINLAPGTYYIKVTSKANAVTNVNYNLKIKGVPIVVNLLGDGLTVKDSNLSANSITLNPVDGPNPQTTAKLEYKIKNTEISNSGSVKVRFYLSRNQTIDVVNGAITAGSGDILLQEITIANPGVPLNSFTEGSVDVLLPKGDDDFWANDNADYYVGMVIDPLNEIPETNELDNSNQGLGKDVDAILIQNVQKPDLLLKAISGPSTISKGQPGQQARTITLNYTAANQGKKSAGSLAKPIGLNFYLYTGSPTLDVSDTSRTREITPQDYFIPLPNQTLSAGTVANPSTTGSISVTLALPSPDDAFWANIAPGTTLYIGTEIDPGNTFPEAGQAPGLTGEENNLNQGLTIDRLQVTLA